MTRVSDPTALKTLPEASSFLSPRLLRIAKDTIRFRQSLCLLKITLIDDVQLFCLAIEITTTHATLTQVDFLIDILLNHV
jgi:hypothetical protein